MSTGLRRSRTLRPPPPPATAPLGLPRLLADTHRDGTPLCLEEHVDRWGPPPLRDAPRLPHLVDSSGLRGRGGAGFPTARKLVAVAKQRKRAIVIANGTEGEPASGKDKVLLRCVPHLVLDGLALVAAAVGADEAVIAIGSGARHELGTVSAALAERQQARLDRTAVRLVTVPDAFVAGEETALVSWLNGGAALPTFVPPRPFERGVRGRPTLVQNVETLANIALIARFGPEWFRSLGTAAEPGSVLVSLVGAVRHPAVYEIGLGMPLRDVFAGAGGPSEPLGAVLLGGYFGTWITVEEADRVALLESELRAIGSSLGARTIAALPSRTCGVLETARVTRYLASASAGQCGPCVYGLRSIAEALERLARRQGDDPERLSRWLGQIEGRGACAHPDGVVRFVASARRVFANEFRLHAAGRCSGGGRPVLPLGETAEGSR